ncbi:Gfo/Idh/MocA family protein [Actinomyces minihominis]|uniref:Gfo/Idh/MocA family protein n=1 Tax=Actinomyces minihominis TaxID=2002838 RepID=UPI000C071D98|nr:Gfo/Idh/MocA family oxidoreductase [Actinomyces minihominis]
MKFGIIGTNFVSSWFVEAARQTNGAVVPHGVFSRTIEGGAAFAQQHGLAASYSDLDGMFEDVDAVYVASPTSAHAGQALAAIARGRHVLLEKTMAENAEITRRVFAAAEDKGVVAMEATRSLHAPHHELIRQALQRLGKLRYAHLENLQYSSRYDRHRAGEAPNAFDPGLGNSAVADIGVYCLEPALDWFGIPHSTSGTSVRLENGFEALGSILLDYGSMLVDIVYSKVISSVTPSTIVGEGGALTIDNLAQPSHIELIPRIGTREVLLDAPHPAPVEGMHFELEEFARQVQMGGTEPRWRDITIAAREIMDEHLARSM